MAAIQKGQISPLKDLAKKQNWVQGRLLGQINFNTGIIHTLEEEAKTCTDELLQMELEKLALDHKELMEEGLELLRLLKEDHAKQREQLRHELYGNHS